MKIEMNGSGREMDKNVVVSYGGKWEALQLHNAESVHKLSLAGERVTWEILAIVSRREHMHSNF